MSMPEPALSYNVDSTPVTARGMKYTEVQLNDAINGSIKDLLLDIAGTVELGDMLNSLASTDFDQDKISQLLEVNPVPEDWLIGEALAEAYVSDSDDCIFPWPTSRDLKNPESSPAGADLTGFQKTEDKESPYRFAFGEVKTSSDGNYPPNVMYGRTGLKKQLEGLRDSCSTKKSLILYLGHHAINAPWQHKFKSATKRILSSDYTDIALFGVLVRDVTPNESDLSKLASSLANNCPASTNFTLYALYLPTNSIPLLQAKSLEALQGGEQ